MISRRRNRKGKNPSADRSNYVPIAVVCSFLPEDAAVRKRLRKVLNFPDRRSPRDTRAERRITAIGVAAYAESDLVVDIILKLETATKERRQACYDLLDASAKH